MKFELDGHRRTFRVVVALLMIIQIRMGHHYKCLLQVYKGTKSRHQAKSSLTCDSGQDFEKLSARLQKLEDLLASKSVPSLDKETISSVCLQRAQRAYIKSQQLINMNPKGEIWR